MAGQFDFDEKRTAQENIEDFLSHVESTNTALGPLLRKHLDKMLPLPDTTKRSTARASFNSEIKKLLDATLVALSSVRMYDEADSRRKAILVLSLRICRHA